ncbi:MAG: VCBS repeat-containing protein [Halioglobus sp.]|nr:VCBS repeat-containing protein [Halioglobus sp.]
MHRARTSALLISPCLSLCLALAACGPAAAPPGGAYCFTRHVIDGSGAGADGVHLADFNGDGFEDVVSGWEESAELKIYLHPGVAVATGFAPWPALEVAAGDNIRDIEDAAFADLDGDGQVDAVLSATEGKGGDANRRLRLHRQVGGTWQDTVLHRDTPTDRFMKVRAAQVDGRNGSDIVALSRDMLEDPGDPEAISTPGGVFLYTAPPEATLGETTAWTRQRLADVHKGKSIELQDFDEDGDTDILYAGARNIVWLENPLHEGRGADWRSHWIGTASDLALCDVNGDGVDDIVATESSKAYPVVARWFAGIDDKKRRHRQWQFHDIRLAEELPFGALTPNNYSTKSIACADLDGDGQVEIAITTSGSGYGIFVVRPLVDPQIAPDTLWQPEPLTGYQWVMKYDNILPADIDGDGDTDLVTSEENEGWLLRGAGVLWYENRSCDDAR